MLLPVVWVFTLTGIYLSFDLYERYLRQLLPAQLAFALWMGRGVWVLWHLRPSRPERVTDSPLRYLAPVTALVVVFALSANLWRGLDPLYHYPDFQRADYRAIAADITNGFKIEPGSIQGCTCPPPV